MIVQPETLLRWHRDFFRFVWRHKSKTETKPGRPPLSDDDTARIKRLARENATWGAERIRGELMDGPAAARGDRIWRRTAVPGPRQRRQVWGVIQTRHLRDRGAEDIVSSAEGERLLRALHRQPAAGVSRPLHHPQRTLPVPDREGIRDLLQQRPAPPGDRAAHTLSARTTPVAARADSAC
jgi:hypothetical protein